MAANKDFETECLFLISLDTFSIHKLNQWTVL